MSIDDRYRHWDDGTTWCIDCGVLTVAGAPALHDALHDRLDRLTAVPDGSLVERTDDPPCPFPMGSKVRRKGNDHESKTVTGCRESWYGSQWVVLCDDRTVGFYPEHLELVPEPEPLTCAVCGEPVHENTAEVVHTYGGTGPFHLAAPTSLSGPAAVLSSAPEPPTSVAPAGEDYGAHVKPIYVDAWDGMAVPYDDHVVAVEAAHAAGMREALADFLTSIDEDDPVYLRGRSDERGRIRKAVEALWIRETVAHENGDIDEKHVWPTPTAFLAVIDNTEDQ